MMKYFVSVALLSLLFFSFDDTDLISNENFNGDKIKEKVLHQFNARRSAHNRGIVQSSRELDAIASQILSTYGKRNFNSPASFQLRLKRNLKKQCNKVGFYSSVLKVQVFQMPLIKLKSDDFYYDPEDNSSSFHLFYGKKPKKTIVISESENEMPRPLIPYSYDDFASELARKLSKSNVKFLYHDKASSFMGFATIIDSKTINKRKVPEVKIVVIYAAKLLDELK